MVELERLAQGNNGEDVSMSAMAERRCRANVWLFHDVRNVSPSRNGHSVLGVSVRLNITVESHICGRRNAVEETVVDDHGGDWRVGIFAEEDVLLDRDIDWRRRPAQFWESAYSIFRKACMQGQHGRPVYPALGRLQNHVRLREIKEREAFVDQSVVMATNAVQQSSQEVLKIDKKEEHDDGPQLGQDDEDDDRGDSSPKHNCHSVHPAVYLV